MRAGLEVGEQGMQETDWTSELTKNKNQKSKQIRLISWNYESVKTRSPDWSFNNNTGKKTMTIRCKRVFHARTHTDRKAMCCEKETHAWKKESQ